MIGQHYSGEIADELDELTGVEHSFMDKPAAVAENYADDRLDERRDGYVEEGRRLDIVDICVLVLPVEASERHELLCLLDERLDDGDSGEGFLREVGEVGGDLLPVVPLLHHITPDNGAGRHKQRHQV